MSIVFDDEFGEIAIHRYAKSRVISFKISTNGKLVATVPKRAPLVMIKHAIRLSRKDIANMLSQISRSNVYSDGDSIGKKHSLLVRNGNAYSVKTVNNIIIVTLTKNDTLADGVVQNDLKNEIAKALRNEAKRYLPKRLRYLAFKMDCQFEKIRFSHAGSRWGSCSSSGTISLNIALMKLPFELIDYVLIHELAHTKHMNHGKDFWNLVAGFDPEYLQNRTLLKRESPHI